MTDVELNKAAEMLEVLKKDYLGIHEQEHDGMEAVDGFSEPMDDLDYSSPQPV